MSSVGVDLDAREPVPEPIQPRPRRVADPRVRRITRVRVPLTLTVSPWATLYRFPDGRRLWCLRLRESGRVRTRCVATERLLAYARASGLAELEAAVRSAVRRATADPPDG